MTKDELVTALNEVLESRRGVDGETHKLHHRFVEAWMEKEDRKRQRIEKVKTTAIGTAVVSIMGGVFWALGWVGQLVIEAMKKKIGQ